MSVESVEWCIAQDRGLSCTTQGDPQRSFERVLLAHPQGEIGTCLSTAEIIVQQHNINSGMQEALLCFHRSRGDEHLQPCLLQLLCQGSRRRPIILNNEAAWPLAWLRD